MLFPESVFALSGGDTIPRVSVDLPAVSFFSRTYNNVGTSFISPAAYTHGDIGFSYDYQNKKQLHLVQEGEDLNQYKLAAEGLVVNKKRMYWGKAFYRNYKKKNVQWNNIYDYNRVGPYLITDSIGGDTYADEYVISGGLAIEHNKWIFGGEADFVAGQNYRKRDPRPKATSTDMNLQLSASYNLIPDYQIGVSGQIGRYKEDVQINVYHESNKYTFFVMKPFGQVAPKLTTYNDRNYSWFYEGTDYSASVYFAPKNLNGFIASMQYKYGYIDATNDNSIKPFTYRTYKWNSEIGWQQNKSNSRTMLRLFYNHMQGQGTERIYYIQKINTVFAQAFLLATYRFYNKETSELGFSGYREWILPKHTLWTKIDIAHNQYEEKYFYPQYKVNIKDLYMSVATGDEIKLKGSSTLLPQVGFAYKRNTSSDNVLPQDQNLNYVEQSMVPNIDIWESNIYKVNLGMQYQYKLRKGYKLYSSLDFAYISDKKNSQKFISFTFGVKY